MFYLSFLGLPRSKIRDNSQENLDFFGFLEKLEDLATMGLPCQWRQLVGAKQQLWSLIREHVCQCATVPITPYCLYPARVSHFPGFLALKTSALE